MLAATGERGDEARPSAAAFLAGAGEARVEVHEFRDGFLPYVGGEVKEVFEDLKEPRRSAARPHACADTTSIRIIGSPVS